MAAIGLLPSWFLPIRLNRMSGPFETDNRLRSYLNTNQERREQMCLALLATDKRFTQIKPRHPRGGPDGGRDIEGIFQDKQLAFGAVGFLNNANDSAPQKTIAKKKYSDDLNNAIRADPKPSTFVFFTNITLTVSEQEWMKQQARDADIKYCELFDRERMRIMLDNIDGLAIRFQFLDIHLSEAEQATFFAKWGDDIQSVISSGFGIVQTQLERIIFLQESMYPLQEIAILFKLKREYAATEIGHFRAFCAIVFKAPLADILSVTFGASDKSGRIWQTKEEPLEEQPSGIAHGICSGAWECIAPENSHATVNDTINKTELLQNRVVSGSRGIGIEKIDHFTISYSKERSFLHYGSRSALREIDDASIIPILSAQFAEKIASFSILANEYEVIKISINDFTIDREAFDPQIPAPFTEEELADQWVRIRPKEFSAFDIRFSQQTPRRFFAPKALD